MGVLSKKKVLSKKEFDYVKKIYYKSEKNNSWNSKKDLLKVLGK